MVVIEEIAAEAEEVKKPASKVPPSGSDEKFAALVITGCGWDDANGLYAPTSKEWHGAQVFENDRKCLLSREPHKTKTGESSYGWIIGQDRKPLYAVQSDSLAPPTSGWRRFNGMLPLPQVQGLDSMEDAAAKAAQALKEQGNLLFTSKRYDEAEAKWTRALELTASRLPEDSVVRVALHSNRSEARLRQQRWADALSDAEAALKARPTHDKALLRAAVAARELKEWNKAQGFVDKCLEVHPKHAEAKQMLLELMELVEQERKTLPDKARSARAKLQEQIEKDAKELDAVGKPTKVKDENNKKMFKALSGYSDKRSNSKDDDRPPLEELPYHKMGLPKDQVKQMDEFFAEQRKKKDDDKKKLKENEDSYAEVKQEYQDRVKEELLDGTAKPIDEVLPQLKKWQDWDSAQREAREEAKQKAYGETKPEQTQTLQSRRQQEERVRLSNTETDEIDKLFLPFEVKQEEPKPVEPEIVAAASEHKKKRLRDAKVTLRTADGTDRRTWREKKLDAEDAQERRADEGRVQAQLEQLTLRRGEPTRFEQAGSEVYCWWVLPPEVHAREIRVDCTKKGEHLKVSVRDVIVFDNKLFKAVRGDDVVWSIEDSELHVTLTKSEKAKIWDQLGEVGAVQRDAKGNVIPESLPPSMSSEDRVAKFREMVTGDDGDYTSYEDMDPKARHLVDVLRRYEHARATGDRRALAEAEVELDEVGRITI